MTSCYVKMHYKLPSQIIASIAGSYRDVNCIENFYEITFEAPVFKATPDSKRRETQTIRLIDELSVHLSFDSAYELGEGSEDDDNDKASNEWSEAENEGLKIINDFLILLRWRSKQSWIGRVVPLSNYQQLTVNSFSGGNIWMDAVVNPNEIPYAYELEKNKLVTSDIWNQIGEDLENAIQPPLEDQLLLDAMYFRVLNDRVKAVLMAAIASEVAIRRCISQLGGRKDGIYSYLVDKAPSIKIVDYISEIMQVLNGHNFKKEQPDTFKKITDLFTARNKIAHHGEIGVSEPAKNTNIRDVAGLIAASDSLIQWLHSLT